VAHWRAAVAHWGAAVAHEELLWWKIKKDDPEFVPQSSNFFIKLRKPIFRIFSPNSLAKYWHFK
jgi:hypothetical protein